VRGVCVFGPGSGLAQRRQVAVLFPARGLLLRLGLRGRTRFGSCLSLLFLRRHLILLDRRVWCPDSMLSGNRCCRGLTSSVASEARRSDRKADRKLRLPRLTGGSRRLCRRRTVALSYLFRRRGRGARPLRRRRRAGASCGAGPRTGARACRPRPAAVAEPDAKRPEKAAFRRGFLLT
jgi:hypothetical protein